MKRSKKMTQFRSNFCRKGHDKQGKEICPVCNAVHSRNRRDRIAAAEQQWLNGPYPGLYPELARRPWRVSF